VRRHPILIALLSAATGVVVGATAVGGLVWMASGPSRKVAKR